MVRKPKSIEIQLPVADVAADRLFDVIEEVHSWTVYWLTHERKGEPARTHLYEERKLSPELVREEGIGYVPASRDGRIQVRTAQHAGIAMEELVAVGVATRNVGYAKREFERHYGRKASSSEELTAFFSQNLLNKAEAYSDAPSFKIDDNTWRRNEHLVFPYRIRDDQGRLRVASWKARTLVPNAGQRYNKLNDTAIFRQSEHLLGYAGYEEQLDAWGEAIFVEGEIDRLAVMQAFREDYGPSHPPVFLLGTSRVTGASALTSDENASLEERAGLYAPLVGRRIVLFIDDDKTGRLTVAGNASAFASLGCRVHIARASMGTSDTSADSPPLKDPSDLLRHHGGTALRRAYARAHATDVIDIELERYREEAANDPEVARTLRHRIAAAKHFSELIVVFPAHLQGGACERVASVLDFDPQILTREVERRLTPAVQEPATASQRA